MPAVLKADQFIERSLLLLQSSPSTTRISITYGSLAKKAEKAEKSSKVSKSRAAAESFVSFKVYDPVSGTLYKLTTHKAKELSRVLTALGPHGVQVTKPVKAEKKHKQDIDTVTTDADGDVAVADTTADKQEATQTIQVRGFSSVLANADIEEEVAEQVKEEPKADAKKETAAKKGKKKKGKR